MLASTICRKRTVDWVDAHLDVGAAALDAHLADDGDRRVAQTLVLLVRQRLRPHGTAVSDD